MVRKLIGWFIGSLCGVGITAWLYYKVGVSEFVAEVSFYVLGLFGAVLGIIVAESTEKKN